MPPQGLEGKHGLHISRLCRINSNCFWPEKPSHTSSEFCAKALMLQTNPDLSKNRCAHPLRSSSTSSEALHLYFVSGSPVNIGPKTFPYSIQLDGHTWDSHIRLGSKPGTGRGVSLTQAFPPIFAFPVKFSGMWSSGMIFMSSVDTTWNENKINKSGEQGWRRQS